MKTRLLSFVLIFMLSVPGAIFQSAVNAQSSFGILGGVNFQNLNGKDGDGDKWENDLLTGYHAGINIQIPIAPDFFFQPGLLFSTKGAKMTDSDGKITINISYVELPLNLVYKPLLGKGHFLLGFGPYVGYGIMGKIKWDDGSEDIKFKNTVTESDTEAFYLKALDAGGNIFAGYELEGGLFIQLNTQFGMIKINPEYEGSTEDKTSVKNTGYGLSLGYRF